MKHSKQLVEGPARSSCGPAMSGSGGYRGESELH